ncbi:hypothetical protein J2W35_004159 [Variovorax boronicumulans]|uniref:hypothetical protein n=1 Tax=Variovorax boronicumulans TaxID=436515 RepID=UPI002786D200|nr:hypothetical protein [Variovorax boronicumulans]MDQ0083793.1 hypothetical protein [Variovorax boronicumulans]
MRTDRATSANETAAAEASSAHAESIDAEAKIHRQISDIYNHLDEKLAEALPGSGHPGNRSPDVTARLLKNAEVLHAAGLDTPQKVNEWMQHCWSHDAKIAGTALGIANNLGYETGMTAASEIIVPRFPAHVLRDPAVLGAAVGLMVGALDVAISVVGGSAAGARIYNHRCDKEMPPSILQEARPLERFIDDTLRATALNVAKNSFRLLAPPLQNAIEGHPNGTIDRTLSDRMDIQIDGLGGFISNSINAVRKLEPGTYDARLMLREDLGAVVRKTRDSWGAAVKDVALGTAQGAKTLVTSPVPVAIAATIGGFISTLFSANTSIDLHANRNLAQASNATIPDDRMHYIAAVQKRASSTAQMGAMSMSIPIVAAMVDRASTMVFDKLSTYLTRLEYPEHGRGSIEPRNDANRSSTSV